MWGGLLSGIFNEQGELISETTQSTLKAPIEIYTQFIKKFI